MDEHLDTQHLLAARNRFYDLSPDRCQVIREVLGSLAGPGPTAEETRKMERAAGVQIAERRVL